MLPLRYFTRNLMRRKLRAAATVAGVAIAIGLYSAMSAVGSSMVSAFVSTGAADEVVISQAGSLNVEFSEIDRNTLTWVQTLEGVVQVAGRVQVSPELYLRGVGIIDGRQHDLVLRGVTETASSTYAQVTLEEGRWPGADHTVTVGRRLARRLGLAIGSTLQLENGRFTVAGILGSGGRVYDQEVWLNLDVLAAHLNRTTYSSYTLRTTSPSSAAALVATVNSSRRFPLTAMRAASFYARSGGMALAIAGVARFIGIIITIGAMLAGMNVMYSSVAARRREIGVLRALGYRRGSILAAFICESLLLCGAGGALGLLIASGIALVPLDLPYLGAQRVFIAGPQVVGGLSLAAAVGVLGGLLPALQAARLELVDALR
jgi:putative ABC transport system permease protein